MFIFLSLAHTTLEKVVLMIDQNKNRKANEEKNTDRKKGEPNDIVIGEGNPNLSPDAGKPII
jgi:hypothetical protein